MSKALLLINLTGNIGGAENRYLNLYNLICQNKNDYYLIINRKLFETYNRNDFFVNKEKIIVLDIDKPNDESNVKSKNKNPVHSSPPAKKNKLRRIARITRHKLKLLKTWMYFIFLLNQTIKKYHIDYIYAIWQGGIWGWFLKKRHQLKFVYSYMDASYASISNNIFDLLEKEYWVLKNADMVDCLSSKIALDLKDRIPFSSQQIISVTPNSFINYKNYFPAKKKENYIVFLSRLNPKKNPLLFLEALIQIHDILISNNYQVLIVGKGSETIKIRNLIANHHLTQVKYLDEVFGSYRLLSKSKIFVSIQKDDNYPSQSLLEAMACENAIIASDVGETRKLVSENEGVVVDLAPDQIGLAITTLIKNEQLCNKLAKNARQKVLTDHTIEAYMEYFYSLEQLL